MCKKWLRWVDYDGLNRRIKKHSDSQAPGSPNGVDTYVHSFYNAGWQVLETRTATSENDQPENLDPKYQYVWSLRYIGAPVLRGWRPGLARQRGVILSLTAPGSSPAGDGPGRAERPRFGARARAAGPQPAPAA